MNKHGGWVGGLHTLDLVVIRNKQLDAYLMAKHDLRCIGHSITTLSLNMPKKLPCACTFSFKVARHAFTCTKCTKANCCLLPPCILKACIGACVIVAVVLFLPNHAHLLFVYVRRQKEIWHSHHL